MGFFFIALAILLLYVCWDPFTRWLKRKAANKAEDYIRKATGMPPRPGSREEKRQRRKGAGYYDDSRETRDNYYSRGRSRGRYGREPIIPKEYAEDVEYVETKEYSQNEYSQYDSTTGREGKKEKSYNESQISDAEWTEIKNPANGKDSLHK